MPINNILFTTETPSDVHPDLMKQFDIRTVPLHVHLGDDEYYDGEITQQYIYDTFKAKKILPSTSAVSVGEYQEFFKPFVDQGLQVIHVAMSSGISSTYNNACIAVKDMGAEDQVHVFDSLALSQTTGLPLFKGAEMAENGASVEEICKAIEDMIPRLDSSFIITSLDFLRHGGRCSTLAALGANILKLNPLINMDGGSMTVGKKYRGKAPKVYLDYIDDRFKDGREEIYDKEFAFVSHVLVEDDILDVCVKHLKDQYHFEKVYVNECSCVITAHGGKGAFGVFALKK